MGSSCSSKKQQVQSPVQQKLPFIPEEEFKGHAAQQSSPLSLQQLSPQNRGSASRVHSPAPSVRSRASIQQSVLDLRNDTDGRSTCMYN
jgi:hypothetical protein